MLLVSVSLSFWQIDVLGFDESFFAKLAVIGNGIALVTGNLFTKYLNKIITDGIIPNLQNLVVCF